MHHDVTIESVESLEATVNRLAALQESGGVERVELYGTGRLLLYHFDPLMESEHKITEGIALADDPPFLSVSSIPDRQKEFEMRYCFDVQSESKVRVRSFDDGSLGMYHRKSRLSNPGSSGFELVLEPGYQVDYEC